MDASIPATRAAGATRGASAPPAGAHPRGSAGTSFAAGLWRLADPKISLASFASLFLAASFAAADGPLHWPWLALTIAGIFAIEVAKNASGEVFDFDSGADPGVKPEDRSPFSGGKRVLVDALLTRRQTWWIAAAGYAVGVASGLLIVALREPGVLWLGVAGMACAWFYQAPPFKLSYRGLGELAVGICYGPLIAAGTYLVQRGEVSWAVVAAALPLGLLIAAFLWINEFPDYAADGAAGKRTLVVQLGRRRASLVFAGIVLLTAVLVALLPFAGVPAAVALGAVGLLPAARAAQLLAAHPADMRRIVSAQGLTLLSFVVYALGAGAGVLLSARG